jgi:hypothetical protein
MHRYFLSGVVAMVFSALAVAQSAAPILLGRFATQLSPQDVADLEAVLPGGVKPWLLAGGNCLACEASIGAYLPPTVETPVLRRGRVLVVRPPTGLIKGAMTNPRAAITSSWTLTDKSVQYAQVAIPGGGFETLVNGRELHAPFSVLGDFDNEELLSVIAFARSNSRWRGVMEVLSRETDGSVRIQVLISNGNLSLEAILRRDGQSWMMLKEWTVSAE